MHPFLKEEEIPPFPVHSNWEEMIYGEENVEGLADTENTLPINKWVIGSLVNIPIETVR